MDRAAWREPPWHIRRSGFPTAWRLARQGRVRRAPVEIGLLDSGVDLDHPLLRGLLGPGLNLLATGQPPRDEHGHGTHIAGILALAAGVGADLMEGELPPIRIRPVKIFDGKGYGRIGDIIEGLVWCAEQGCEIINLSFGTDGKASRALARAVRELDEASILLVGAAGNDGNRGAVDIPGRYPEVLAVAASNRRDKLARFSSRGPEVDLVAPGSGVLSLAPGGGSRRMSGTSMAAPHVTAAAALLLATEPGLSPAAVKRRLKRTAEWLPEIPAQAQGAGLLRADRLLRGHP
ncbi:MAG: S8 family serine peptidase [Bacillota bacterium]